MWLNKVASQMIVFSVIDLILWEGFQCPEMVASVENGFPDALLNHASRWHPIADRVLSALNSPQPSHKSLNLPPKETSKLDRI